MQSIFTKSTHQINWFATLIVPLLACIHPTWGADAVMAPLDAGPRSATIEQTGVITPPAIKLPMQQISPKVVGPTVRPQIKNSPKQMVMPQKPRITTKPEVMRPKPTPARPEPKIALPTKPQQVVIPKLPSAVTPDMTSIRAEREFARDAKNAATLEMQGRRQADIGPQRLHLQKPGARNAELPSLGSAAPGSVRSGPGLNSDGLIPGADPTAHLRGFRDGPTAGDGLGDGIAGEEGDKGPSLSTPGFAFGEGTEGEKLRGNMEGGKDLLGLLGRLYGPVVPGRGAGDRAGHHDERQGTPSDGPTNVSTDGSTGGATKESEPDAPGPDSLPGDAANRLQDMIMSEMLEGRDPKVTWKGQGEGYSVQFSGQEDGYHVDSKGNVSHADYMFESFSVGGGQTTDGSDGDVSGKGSPVPMSVRRKINDGTTAGANIPAWEPAVSGAGPIDPISQGAATTSSSNDAGSGAQQGQKQQHKEEKNYAGKTPGSGLIGPADPNLPGGKGGKGALKAPKGFHVIDPVASQTAATRNNPRTESALDSELGILSGPAVVDPGKGASPAGQ